MYRQSGSAFWGLLAGILVGLGIAFATAVFVSQVPTPFGNKELIRTAEDDRQEIAHNLRWNPNAPLAGRSSPALIPPPAAVASAVTHLGVDPEDDTEEGVDSVPGRPRPDPYDYWVQTSSYAGREDALAMRARVRSTGFSAQVVERFVNGGTKHFVRVGPLASREDAEDLKISLDGVGCVCTLVRVER